MCFQFENYIKSVIIEYETNVFLRVKYVILSFHSPRIVLKFQDDPSVYQYDEIYDDMKEDKAKKLVLSKQDKTPKYAKNLLRNAAVRKLENDRFTKKNSIPVRIQNIFAMKL